MKGDKWYRIEDCKYSKGCDEWDNPIPGFTTGVVVYDYTVDRETLKGVWLDNGFGNKHFVLRSAHKRFACPTFAEAVESFKARKKRQLGILEANASHVRSALRQVDQLKEPT